MDLGGMLKEFQEEFVTMNVIKTRTLVRKRKLDAYQK